MANSTPLLRGVERNQFDPDNLRHHFANREPLILVVKEKLNQLPPLPVLMFYGIGGAGKTYLVRYLLYEYGCRWSDPPKGYPHAFLSFRSGHTPTYAHEALWQVRRQLQRYGKRFVFTRFDLLWGIFWERTSQTPVSQNPTLLPEEADWISDLLQSTTDLPFIGDVAKTLNLVDRLKRRVQHALAVRGVLDWFKNNVEVPMGTGWKIALHSMELGKLSKLLPVAFAADLADTSDNLPAPHNRVLIFIDNYEPLQEQTGQSADFIQTLAEELAGNTANTLVIIAGRERLSWAEVRRKDGTQVLRRPDSSIWVRDVVRRDLYCFVGRYLEQYLVGDLTMTDAMQYLLHQRKLGDEQLAQNTYYFTGGYPLALGVAADLIQTAGAEATQEINDLRDKVATYELLSEGWRDEVNNWLLERLFEQLTRQHREELITLTKAAAVPRWFTENLLFHLMDDYNVPEQFRKLVNYSFVEPYEVEGIQAYRLHERVRNLLRQSMGEDIRWPQWEKIAVNWFTTQGMQLAGSNQRRYQVEVLYHQHHIDPKAAAALFQQMAEELVRSHQIEQLASFLRDVRSYIDEQSKDSIAIWHRYYSARMMHLEGELEKTEPIFYEIGIDEKAETLVRAYALCDLAAIYVRMERLSQPGGVEKALEILERCKQMIPQMDPKLISIYGHHRSIHNYKCEWEESIAALEQQQKWFEAEGNIYGVLDTFRRLQGVYALMGNWPEAEYARQRMLQGLDQSPSAVFLKARSQIGLTWSLIWSGRYYEAETEVREGLRFARKLNDVSLVAEGLAELAQALGAQRRFEEANKHIRKSVHMFKQLGKEFSSRLGNTWGVWGAMAVRQGNLDEAQTYLEQSLAIKRQIGDVMGIPELLFFLGELHECQHDWLRASKYYEEHISQYQKVRRRNFDCGVFTNLARVKFMQGDYETVPPLLTRAEALAKKYKYYDYLAIIRLTQAHIAWTGKVTQWGSGFNDALLFYQSALLYALYYNRFLLDEVLGDESVTTPLRSIIQECLIHGLEGQEMLKALRSWWKTKEEELFLPGNIRLPNDSHSLLEAEEIARKMEPGNGSPQQYITDRISKALASRHTIT